MLIEYLKKSSLFSGLDDRSLEELTFAASIKKTAKNEVIFYESDPAFAFFIVGSGKVKIFKLSPDGKEQILMISKTGESFAEAAMFDGANYPASAQSLEECELIMFNRDKFASVLAKNPNLAMNLLGRLSQLLRQLTRLIEGLSLTDVTSRLAHYIIEELESGKGPELSSFTLREKKSILASQLGTIPETLSRSFSKLSKEKVIAVSGSEIKVLNKDKLREFAGF